MADETKRAAASMALSVLDEIEAAVMSRIAELRKELTEAVTANEGAHDGPDA